MSAPIDLTLDDDDASLVSSVEPHRSASTNFNSQSTDPGLSSGPSSLPSTSFRSRSTAPVPQLSIQTSSSQNNTNPKRRRHSSCPDLDSSQNLDVTTPTSPFKRLRFTPLSATTPSFPPPSALLPTPLSPLPPAIQQTSTRPFNLFSSLLTQPELILEFAKHLPIPTLISLYAISPPFHFILNNHFTTLITSIAQLRAPTAAAIFIFRCYRSLCQLDPAGRYSTAPARAGTVRYVPTLRWLQMILFREMVVDEILALMASEGHNMPEGMAVAVKKMWFTIDISDNYRRVGIMHNKAFWTNEDLYLATEFVIKLDMRLTHPVTGSGDTGFREMLLGQRSLSTLWKVLRREECRSQLEVLKMKVRWNYEEGLEWNMEIMGVPPEEQGALRYEGWGDAGRGVDFFVMVDELVMREGIRRGLRLEGSWMDMMLDGFVDKEAWRDFEKVDVEIVEEVESEVEWETDSEDSGEEEGGEVGLKKGEVPWDTFLGYDGDEGDEVDEGLGLGASTYPDPREEAEEEMNVEQELEVKEEAGDEPDEAT